MFVSQAHSFTQQARLAITLAWVAGYTNIVTLIVCGTATSHMSGTVAQWGRDLVEGRWGLAVLTTFLIGAFLLGAVVSAVCTEIGRRRGWESVYVLPMAAEAVLLTALAVVLQLRGDEAAGSAWVLYTVTGLAATAMGLQNATITRISSGVVRTTHMTGVLTDLGLESVQLLFWLRDRLARAGPRRAVAVELATHPLGRRPLLLASVVGSFALGAGLGATAHGLFPGLSMFPPVLFLLWIVYQDAVRPIAEIEPSDLVGDDPGDLHLPAGIGAFHLRADRGRSARGRPLRLPNLLAWSERLPPTVRVVVLDLCDVRQIDDNSALELRALVHRFRGQGRRLVLAGISPGQYAGMRASGAGDAIDATNVCPDFELAIARGLTLLDTLQARHGDEAGPR